MLTQQRIRTRAYMFKDVGIAWVNIYADIRVVRYTGVNHEKRYS